MKIELLEGVDKGRILDFETDEPVLIGRGKECHVCLNDNELSRRHARIFFENDEVLIEDLDSTNGTFVNGKTVFRKSLSENDEIRAGNTVLTISDLPDSKSCHGSTLNIHDKKPAIIASLHHEKADLLKTRQSQVLALL